MDRHCANSALGDRSATNDSLTYAAAGVSVDNGNALVDAIKPIVKATRRPGADGEIGGFGGAFDLKSAGFRDPVLVSGTDGVGTKLRVALDCGIHTSVGESDSSASSAGCLESNLVDLSQVSTSSPCPSTTSSSRVPNPCTFWTTLHAPSWTFLSLLMSLRVSPRVVSKLDVR